MFSRTTIWKHQFFGTQPYLWSHLHDCCKNHSFDYTDCCWQTDVSAFFFFNMLSRFIIAFCPRRKQPNFMAAVTVHSDFGAWENKICHYSHFFPFYLPWSDGARYYFFLKLNFKPAFPLSSLTFFKKLFSSSSLSAIRVASSAYLKLPIFLLAILILAWDSSSPAFHLMYAVCKLNKQDDDIQPYHTIFPVWNQLVVPCLVVTVASWPTYRFLRRQVRLSGVPISLRMFHSLLSSTESKALA